MKISREDKGLKVILNNEKEINMNKRELAIHFEEELEKEGYYTRYTLEDGWTYIIHPESCTVYYYNDHFINYFEELYKNKEVIFPKSPMDLREYLKEYEEFKEFEFEC